MHHVTFGTVMVAYAKFCQISEPVSLTKAFFVEILVSCAVVGAVDTSFNMSLSGTTSAGL